LLFVFQNLRYMAIKRINVIWLIRELTRELTLYG
jgi:hypothetical protein